MEEEGEIDDPAEPVCKFINRGPPFAKALDGEDHWDGGEAKPVEGPEPPSQWSSPSRAFAKGGPRLMNLQTGSVGSSISPSSSIVRRCRSA